MNTRRATLHDYLQLFRLSNVFTAMADVTMGFLFAGTTAGPAARSWPAYLMLAIASAALYTAGMVLNDVWDVERDRRQRPERPLPAGRIDLAHARRLGFAMLTTGILLGWLSGYVDLLRGQPLPGSLPWRAGLIATLLAASILSYDAVLKTTPLGPPVMGGCRLLNVLLGMAVAASADPSVVLGFGSYQLLAAAGIGLYIAGVTWFARSEAVISNRVSLSAATAVMLAGITVLGMLFRWLPAGILTTLRNEQTWWLLLGLLAFTIVRRCLRAVSDPRPLQVQLAVRHGIWSLIVLDAAVVLLVCPPMWSLAVLALLLPTVLLGQWIRAT